METAVFFHSSDLYPVSNIRLRVLKNNKSTAKKKNETKSATSLACIFLPEGGTDNWRFSEGGILLPGSGTTRSGCGPILSLSMDDCSRAGGRPLP